MEILILPLRSILILPYEASMATPQLQMHEGMIGNTRYIVSGILMGFIGFILSMIGFIFAVTHSAQASIEQETTAQGVIINGSSRDKDVNQQVMFIQLSAFAGYVISFGTVIVPVVLWLIWRDKDPYLNEMGREAVNFQLSMTF